jgi:hypothetical protein
MTPSNGDLTMPFCAGGSGATRSAGFGGTWSTLWIVMRRWLGVLLTFASACNGSGSTADAALCEAKLSLVDQHLWTLLPDGTDPFRPPLPDGGQDAGDGADAGLPGDAGDAGAGGSEWGRGPCPETEMRYEDFGGEDSLTVYTRVCSWTTVEQPSLVSIQGGEPLNIRIWYFSQTTTEVAEALVLVAADDAPFWQATVPLPSESGLLFETFNAPADVLAGRPVRWHLRNHGSNSWNFLELTVTRRVPCGSVDGGTR